MKKFAIAAFAAFVALFATLTLTNVAQAYPEVQIHLTSDHEVVYGGGAFTVSATSNVNCAWALDWNDQSRAASGTDFNTKFVAPKVTKITKLPLSGICTYANPSGRTAAAATPATSPQQLTITVLPTPAATTNTAALAGTGGPDKVVLISGLLLLVAGATVAMVARRRAEHAELPARSV